MTEKKWPNLKGAIKMSEQLKTKLKGLGLTDEQIEKLISQGAVDENDFADATIDLLVSVTGCGPFVAKRIINAFKPASTETNTAANPAAAAANANEEIPEGKAPSAAQMNGFAAQFGIDPGIMQAIMFSNLSAGAGFDFDFSSMVPINQIAGSYSPKIRNMVYMFMGQIEKSLGGVPIVVINADGGVNAELTAKYVLSLQEGFDPADSDIYYDEEGNPYQLIKVGVDAQSVYDSDPLDSSRPLQKNGMGVGRIHWGHSPLDVRQMVFLAVNETEELSPSNESQVARLRDNIKNNASRMTLQGDFPKAYTLYNEKLRTGALPTLRVQLSRTARRPEVMPRRRTRPEGGQPGSGDTFREGKPY